LNPGVPESEFSGIVVDSGESSFKISDEVIGVIPLNIFTSDRGALAQYVLVKSVHLALKPQTMSWESAAGLSVCGMTAWRSVFKYYRNFNPGRRVFVHGGSSSVGRQCIQIAKISGAYVVTSCSAASEVGVRALGPDEILDYQSSPLYLQLARSYPFTDLTSSPLAFNLIIDCIGDNNNLFAASPSYLAPDGKYVQPGGDISDGILSILWRVACNSLWPTWAGGVPRSFKFFAIQLSDTERIDELGLLSKWVDDGKLRVDVDSIHGFDRDGVMAAYECIMTGKAKGKVVVRVS
jgi:NADPH:quinone reductase-like Zn-dependent oxidoreductase